LLFLRHAVNRRSLTGQHIHTERNAVNHRFRTPSHKHRCADTCFTATIVARCSRLSPQTSAAAPACYDQHNRSLRPAAALPAYGALWFGLFGRHDGWIQVGLVRWCMVSFRGIPLPDSRRVDVPGANCALRLPTDAGPRSFILRVDSSFPDGTLSLHRHYLGSIFDVRQRYSTCC